ncbi:menaquinone biosynthesis protein [Leptospira perolatii]|uniref:1,4-dihydroxy-6-naphtoate synthase n=1 Tax=Leptospira perolatii TaxID=2023191 RepID=A0A2M9ZPR0_9LEPT|nr:1,4-dihydroxy-6-naphthoate synthase [Leptospira perolatii]PJZ70942.1 menaquinone biosynthesis protein [Leptospira perolatii]PJZ74068.1 menaquinone biosynthesis protein [Leptospira perolatii]
MELSLAYSPCPNDTFIFYHLISGKTNSALKIREELFDVENLNQFAKEGRFHSTKLSFAAYFHVADRYALLDSGSALGRNCGPLIVKRKGNKANAPKGKKILVPGLWTTANLLLHLYLQGDYEPVPMRYDLILDHVKNGEADFGVLIHEERFTYEKRDMEKVRDLGEWWEEYSGAPIPLGCIAVRRDIEESVRQELDRALKESIDLAFKNRESTYQYIFQHSQDTTKEVVDSHINLYVNQYTKSLGEEGRKAISLLYKESLRTGLVPQGRELFV